MRRSPSLWQSRFGEERPVDRKQMATVLPSGGSVLVFPPPVAAMNRAERPAAVQGAPGLGAAQRTHLDGEDRSATPQQSTGGCGGKTIFPAGELRVCG
jgi:hypothetical protein